MSDTGFTEETRRTGAAGDAAGRLHERSVAGETSRVVLDFFVVVVVVVVGRWGTHDDQTCLGLSACVVDTDRLCLFLTCVQAILYVRARVRQSVGFGGWKTLGARVEEAKNSCQSRVLVSPP